jgi:hypothetical protein
MLVYDAGLRYALRGGMGLVQCHGPGTKAT